MSQIKKSNPRHKNQGRLAHPHADSDEVENENDEDDEVENEDDNDIARLAAMSGVNKQSNHSKVNHRKDAFEDEEPPDNKRKPLRQSHQQKQKQIQPSQNQKAQIQATKAVLSGRVHKSSSPSPEDDEDDVSDDTLASSAADADGESSSSTSSTQTKASNRHPPPSANQRKKHHTREEWADKLAAKQEKRWAGREEGGKIITVKAERQKMAKEADISSGVANALQQLALQKKKKQMLKKMKKHNKEVEEEEEDEEDNDSAGDADEEEEDEEEDNKGEDEEDADDVSEGEEEVDNEPIQYATLEEEVAAYREDQHITLSASIALTDITSPDLSSDPLYYPIRAFSDLSSQYSLPQAILSALFPPEFTIPTPIQSQVWPCILIGKDVVGVAVTGSGKTLAFLLGAFVLVQNKKEKQVGNRPSGQPLVVILSPTRELALQTFSIVEDASKKLNITSISLVGGPSIEGQTEVLKSDIDIVVATPGRLVKLIAAGALSLKSCLYFVCDEADRVLELGFQEQLHTITSSLPKIHQTLLFSATWPPSVSSLASNLVRSDKVIKISIGVGELNVASTVSQIVEIVDRRSGKREKRILELLNTYPPTPHTLVIIFTLYKRESVDLSEYLTRHGHKSQSLNSDKTQTQRNSIVASFRNGSIPVLVATDVAARGLDIPNITLVINFSIGLSIEHYIHRVGRCGRAGRKGLAVSFFVDYDLMVAPDLITVLSKSGVTIPPELKDYAMRAERKSIKHKDEVGLKGDALFAHRRAKKAAEDEDEIDEDAIFGVDDGTQKYVGGKGKKIHAIHLKGRNNRAGGAGGGGGRRGGGHSGRK